MEKFKEGFAGGKEFCSHPNQNLHFTQPKFRKKDICDELVKISELNTTHRAKKYLINRGINEDTLSKLYYCPDFKRVDKQSIRRPSTIQNTMIRESSSLFDISDGQLFWLSG